MPSRRMLYSFLFDKNKYLKIKVRSDENKIWKQPLNPLLLVHEEYYSLLDEPDKCNDDEWFEEVDDKMFTFKTKVRNWLNDTEVEQGH